MINTSPLLEYVTDIHDIKAINQWRSDVEQQLNEAYDHGTTIREIVRTRSNVVDEALMFLWKHSGLDQTDLGLFAVGGYGRREMLPYSDVDIMTVNLSSKALRLSPMAILLKRVRVVNLGVSKLFPNNAFCE